ncbi:hypothetical protein J6590_042140 [Homalodisca vitripennis]|nr:hypothetical protein J6590_042140 [Homalodisca vitripennis]
MIGALKENTQYSLLVFSLVLNVTNRLRIRHFREHPTSENLKSQSLSKCDCGVPTPNTTTCLTSENLKSQSLSKCDCGVPTPNTTTCLTSTSSTVTPQMRLWRPQDPETRLSDTFHRPGYRESDPDNCGGARREMKIDTEGPVPDEMPWSRQTVLRQIPGQYTRERRDGVQKWMIEVTHNKIDSRLENWSEAIYGLCHCYQARRNFRNEFQVRLTNAEPRPVKFTAPGALPRSPLDRSVPFYCLSNLHPSLATQLLRFIPKRLEIVRLGTPILADQPMSLLTPSPGGDVSVLNRRSSYIAQILADQPMSLLTPGPNGDVSVLNRRSSYIAQILADQPMSLLTPGPNGDVSVLNHRSSYIAQILADQPMSLLTPGPNGDVSVLNHRHISLRYSLISRCQLTRPDGDVSVLNRRAGRSAWVHVQSYIAQILADQPMSLLIPGPDGDVSVLNRRAGRSATLAQSALGPVLSAALRRATPGQDEPTNLGLSVPPSKKSENPKNKHDTRSTNAVENRKLILVVTKFVMEKGDFSIIRGPEDRPGAGRCEVVLMLLNSKDEDLTAPRCDCDRHGSNPAAAASAAVYHRALPV